MAKHNHVQVSDLVQGFVSSLTLLIDEETQTRAREAVLGAFGAPAGRGGGRRTRMATLQPRQVQQRQRGPVSPRQRLAGRYVGLLRLTTGKDREKVRALYASKGVEAAIKMLEGISAARAS